jgi:hypothetical protein
MLQIFSNAPGSIRPTTMNISAKNSIRVLRDSPDIAACFPKSSYRRTLTMAAHLARHRRVNHTSALFGPTLQRFVQRLEALTCGVEQTTAHKADQQAGEALGVVQAATSGRQQFELECVLAVEQARH